MAAGPSFHVSYALLWLTSSSLMGIGRNPSMKVHPLRVERERRGWSQARVAEALGVSNRTVTRWELRIAIPYPYYREQLAQLFGKSLQELDLLPPEQQPDSPPDLPQEP